MKKKMMALIILVVFLMAAIFTVALANPPGSCKNCRKTDCPTGYCYVDCVSCCYLFHGNVYCFK